MIFTSHLNTETQPAAAQFVSCNPSRREPSLRQALLLWAVTALVFVITVSSFRPYFALAHNFGDTAAYVEITTAIRTWNFSDIQVKHFWGLPYVAALFSRVTMTSPEISVILVSAASSLVALILSYRLWGGWVSLFFSLLNFDWLQRSFLGGSEPLFLALLLASFVAIRRERWLAASLLASLATITRPLGICLLVGIGVTLMMRRDWRRLSGAIAVALAIGLLYMLPLRLYLHDPLATVHSYGVLQASPYPSPFGIPFRALISGTLHGSAPWTNLLLTFAWIVLVIAGNIAMFATQDFRTYAKSHLPETIFLALYLLSLYSYNAPGLARGNFPRFSIPILPFVFIALSRWLPKDRRLLWCAAVLCPALAACSALGVQNVIAILHRGK